VDPFQVKLFMVSASNVPGSSEMTKFKKQINMRNTKSSKITV
jgi:hypothetical protein